jgi:hypothetical protein
LLSALCTLVSSASRFPFSSPPLFTSFLFIREHQEASGGTAPRDPSAAASASSIAAPAPTVAGGWADMGTQSQQHEAPVVAVEEPSWKSQKGQISLKAPRHSDSIMQHIDSNTQHSDSIAQHTASITQYTETASHSMLPPQVTLSSGVRKKRRLAPLPPLPRPRALRRYGSRHSFRHKLPQLR